MKNKYIVIFSLVALALAGLSVPASAQTGASCYDPIVLGDNYSATISGAGTKWYIANTFDLPLAIAFYPTNANAPAPELYLDFSCTPGEYDDPILCGLFCSSNSAYISMPYKQIPSLSYDEQSRPRYLVEFGQFYRDMLLSQGIDYNVPVYIRVVFSGAGQLTMAPDEFSSCMDGPKFMHLGDTVEVQADDRFRHVIVPYVQWQYDSIRYVWQGTQPCTMAVGNKCGFDPTGTDDVIIDQVTIQPGGMAKVSSELLMQYVSDQTNYPNDAGMYFAKFYSTESGVMKIEKIPAPPPAGGATLLKYGTKTNIYRNDTSALYAMPSSWVKAMQFSTPTDHVFKMYIGSTPNFYLDDAFATYQFDKTENGHLLSLFKSDMESIWTHKVTGDNYLYVRFECSDNTTVLPMLWTPSDCEVKAQRIQLRTQFEVASKTTDIYSLYYEELRGGDMTIAWTNTQTTCPFYIADTCDVPNSNVPPVFYTDKAPKKGSITIPANTVDAWAQYVDPEGYLYIRFYSNGKGKITVTSTAPEETDPICNTYDSVLTVTAWDSCMWRGTKYTQSGDYILNGTVDAETGCMDSTFTLHLTIHTTTYEAVSLSGCGNAVYGDHTYAQTGEYVDTTYDASGNRTITTLHITVNHPSASDTTATACESFSWKGTTYTQSGDYTYTTTNIEGCDSVVTLHLTVNHPTAGEETLTACDSLYWNGEWRKESGDYEYHTTNVAGCDSVVTLHLTVNPSYRITLSDVEACEEYQWGDTMIFDSGTYTRYLHTRAGCDSIVTLKVTINHESYGLDEVTAYDSYTWINGTTYTASTQGQISYLTNAVGCDSVVSLKLTIRHLVEKPFARTLCETELPYEWYGKFYTESGIYSSDTIKGKAIDGVYMDTVHTVDLTVIPVTTGDTAAAACKSFTWYGTTYTESGDYDRTLVGANRQGCDSIVTLHLTIHQPTYSEVSHKACESFEWNGETYRQSGDYTYHTQNMAGCDSIATLHLTIGHTSSGEQTIERCDSYTSPAGIVYTESGTYTETFTNANGCDSVVTLYLTIEKGCVHYYDTVYFCRGYNTEHEERLDEETVRRYRMYVYESPATWDYMAGVMVSGESNRTLVDLNRAEQNLHEHYVGQLTPVEAILWSTRDEDGAYRPVTVEQQPQWIATGRLAVQIQFLCGQIYNSEFPMDIDNTSSAEQQAAKRIVNGQLLIIRGEKTYRIDGRLIR